MLTIDNLVAWGTALVALVTTIVTVWRRASPVLIEAITLLRQAADAVGVHDSDARLTEKVDAIGKRLDQQANRITILEVQVAQLDCQDGSDVTSPPSGMA